MSKLIFSSASDSFKEL